MASVVPITADRGQMREIESKSGNVLKIRGIKLRSRNKLTVPVRRANPTTGGLEMGPKTASRLRCRRNANTRA